MRLKNPLPPLPPIEGPAWREYGLLGLLLAAVFLACLKAMAAWLCGPLRPMAEELLSDDVLGKVPFLDAAVPRRLWRQHLNRKADHRKPLWALLCFLDWWRKHESGRVV